MRRKTTAAGDEGLTREASAVGDDGLTTIARGIAAPIVVVTTGLVGIAWWTIEVEASGAPAGIVMKSKVGRLARERTCLLCTLRHNLGATLA